MSATTSSPNRPAVGVAPILVFLGLAFGLAWLLALPLWLGQGLAEPIAPMLLILVMYTPAVAVLIVMLVMRPVPVGQRLRFLGMWPLRPVKRVLGMSAIGLFGTLAVVVLGMVIAMLLGWLPADLIAFSGYAEMLRATVPAGTALPPVQLLIAVQLVSIPIAAATINAVAAFGEEIGWRGFLVPALRPWGTATALTVSGIAWGLWHAPIILLGYNFARPDVTGVLLMVGGCLAWGVLLGWLRLRSASMWPAVFAHGAMNAAMGLPMLIVAAGATIDPALALGLGVSGWIACGIVILVLWLTGQFRPQPQLAPSKSHTAS